MIEFAAVDVIVQREDLAGRVRDALAAAGLPIVAPDMSQWVGRAGAEVRIDRLADCHSPVRVEWHADRSLEQAFRQAAMAQEDSAPAFLHFRVVVETMLRAIVDILASSGFTVRDSTNDFAPLTIEVLDAPLHHPHWSGHPLS